MPRIGQKLFGIIVCGVWPKVGPKYQNVHHRTAAYRNVSATGKETMDQKKEITGKYRFDQDSKRFHRFRIETDVGVVGTVYIPKDMGGSKLPKRITLEYASKDS